MLKKLARLREAPKGVRDRYAFGMAASFTAIVALLWVVALPGRFEQISSENPKPESSMPFASLFKGMRDQVASVKSANEETMPPIPEETVTTPIEPAATPPLDPNAITLTPEEISAASGQAGGYTETTTTAPRIVQIVTTSSLTSTSSGATTTGTQR